MDHILLKDLTCKWRDLENVRNSKHIMILSQLLSSENILTHIEGVSQLIRVEKIYCCTHITHDKNFLSKQAIKWFSLSYKQLVMSKLVPRHLIPYM